jgi:hypothetical protein
MLGPESGLRSSKGRLKMDILGSRLGPSVPLERTELVVLEKGNADCYSL